jgi:hypothetical protein
LDEEAARKASAFSAPKGARGLATVVPAFHWSYASTHRVEALPGGGMIINLTDRCALVISIMLIPVCKMGEIKARGNLLEHMDDPKPLGATDNDLP